MGRPRNPIPSYLRHKPSGQAIVWLDGRSHYLGPYGSRESREEYAKLVTRLQAGEPVAAPSKLPEMTITRSRP